MISKLLISKSWILLRLMRYSFYYSLQIVVLLITFNNSTKNSLILLSLIITFNNGIFMVILLLFTNEKCLFPCIFRVFNSRPYIKH